MPRTSRSADIARAARDLLAIERLRPGQEEAVRAVLDGEDVLVVFPSGYGKSAIYQLAGALLPGSTLVVSPLIALQRDQQFSIDEQDAGGAAVVNSALPAGEREQALDDFGENLEFLLLAPEQLANPEVMERLQASPPSLFVVDEAHCVSEWGHDFRPDYLRLATAIEALGHPRVLALTATAAPPVRDEIVERLGLRSPRVLVRGFDRPNLQLAVEAFTYASAKHEAFLQAVDAAARPGIVYVATRARAEELAAELTARGVSAAAYHAGLPAREREAAQQAFMADELEVMVATTAFGMGVDKPDIRFVFHYEVSQSLDAYYQEIGRAGRDGAPAQIRLFYRSEDLGIRRFFAGGAGINEDELEALLQALSDRRGSASVDELAADRDVSDTQLLRALNLLAEAGAVEVSTEGVVRRLKRSRAAAQAQAAEAQDGRRQFERSRVEMMQRYAETNGCRRAFLLAYFGEQYEPPCDHCDNCEAGRGQTAPPAAVGEAGRFEVGSRVRHEQFGGGQVMQQEEGNRLVILFDEVGYKTIDVTVAGESLQPGEKQAEHRG